MHKILDGCKDVEESKEKIKVLTGDELKEPGNKLLPGRKYRPG